MSNATSFEIFFSNIVEKEDTETEKEDYYPQIIDYQVKFGISHIKFDRKKKIPLDEYDIVDISEKYRSNIRSYHPSMHLSPFRLGPFLEWTGTLQKNEIVVKESEVRRYKAPIRLTWGQVTFTTTTGNSIIVNMNDEFHRCLMRWRQMEIVTDLDNFEEDDLLECVFKSIRVDKGEPQSTEPIIPGQIRTIDLSRAIVKNVLDRQDEEFNFWLREHSNNDKKKKEEIAEKSNKDLDKDKSDEESGEEKSEKVILLEDECYLNEPWLDLIFEYKYDDEFQDMLLNELYKKQRLFWSVLVNATPRMFEKYSSLLTKTETDMDRVKNLLLDTVEELESLDDPDVDKNIAEIMKLKSEDVDVLELQQKFKILGF